MPVELEMAIYVVISGFGVFGTLVLAIVLHVIYGHKAKERQ